jgi:uncharacterized iron-regulated protein
MNTRTLIPTPILILAVGIALGTPVSAGAQDAAQDSAYVPGAYRVFDGSGAPATLDDVVAAMAGHEVVFVGETHDDPTGHMLEAELLRRAHEVYASRGAVLSLEFFERDIQPVVDEYIAGLITESAFRSDGRPWPRYESDYRPMVEFAKESGIPVVAANAPRRYVTGVSRGGRDFLDSLGPDALATLAPLPYGEASEAYTNQWIQQISEVMDQEGMKCGVPVEQLPDGVDAGPPPPPPGAHAQMGNQLQSQVLWDATMAYWINDALLRRPDALVVHAVGSFHVARGTGIPEQLERYRPGASSMIVMLRPVEDVDRFEPAPAGAWGDFVIQTDASRTLEAIECRQLLRKIEAQK